MNDHTKTNRILTYDFGFNDFPGRFAMTVYFQGCQLRCPFCHNKALLDEEAEGLPIEDVVEAYCSMQKTMPGTEIGIVLSGGEPALPMSNSGTVHALINSLPAAPYALHTNGLQLLRTLPPRLEYVVVSVKSDKTLESNGIGRFVDFYREHLYNAFDMYDQAQKKELRVVNTEELKKGEDTVSVLRRMEHAARQLGWSIVFVDDSRTNEGE